MRSILRRPLRNRQIAAGAAVAVLALGAGVALAIASGVFDGGPASSGSPDVVAIPSAWPSPLDADGVVDPSAGPSTSPPLPTRTPGAAQLAANRAWTLPPDWEFEQDCNREDAPCAVHLFDADGAERPGWPVDVPGNCYPDVVVGPRNSAFLACDRGGRVVVTGLDASGAALAGWPVRIHGTVAWGESPPVAVGWDETVYVAVQAPGTNGRYRIHAFDVDGSAHRGWPRTIAGEVPGFIAAPDGTIVAWWYEGVVEDTIDFQARRTQFTKIDGDGHTLAGWPIGSKGAATAPVAWGDGSIYYTSATAKVWGHDVRGAVIRGWPYELGFPAAPALRSDGSLLFIGQSEVVVLDRQGSLRPGWPYESEATFNGPSCDTPSSDYQIAALADDRLYVAEWDEDHDRGAIVALDASGRVQAGWPYRVREGWRVSWLDVPGDGSVTAALASDWCDDSPGSGWTLRLAADGTLIGSPPPMAPTPLYRVYDALRLEHLHTATGASTFPQGAAIEVEGALVNRSSTPVVLPYVDYYGDSWYAAGTIQTWLQRIGPSDLDCLPNASRKGTWYATGGWINVSSVPVTIEPGDAMPTTLQAGLSPDLTACLPPGQYRYHVEYKPLDAELDDIIDEVAIDLTITPSDAGRSPSGGPTRSPAPTPSPTPRSIATPTPTPMAQTPSQTIPVP